MPVLYRAVLAVLALILAGMPARSAEFSEVRPIGFSADGAVFAFEEFGVYDGSGFPFASRFFIDTVSDSFLPDSTIRVVIEDEEKTVADARAAAAAQSRDLEDQYSFLANPGVIAAFNPLSELDSDAHQLRYLPISVVPAFFRPYTVQLTETKLPSDSPCDAMTEARLGFRLDLTEVEGEPVAIVLHEDGFLPKSRFCPTGYRLGGVVTHWADGVWTHAYLVLSQSFGFEGEHGRWMAVTHRFE
jgi:predicted secreted protein